MKRLKQLGIIFMSFVMCFTLLTPSVFADINNNTTTSSTEKEEAKPLEKCATNLRVSSYSGTLSIKWDRSRDAGYNDYEVLRSTRPDGPYTQVGTGRSSFYDNYFSAGTTYYYKVRDPENKELMESDYVSFTTDYNLISSFKPAYSNESIKISYSGNYIYDDYELWRSEGYTGGFYKIADLTTYGSSYIDYDVNPKKTYYYKIIAKRDNISLTVAAPSSVVTPAFKRIDSFDAKCVNYNTEITWKDSRKNYHNCEIWRSEFTNGGFKKIASVTGSSYTDIDVVPGKIYYYMLKGKKYDSPYTGLLELAEPISVKIPDANVSDFSAESENGTMHIKWNSPESLFSEFEVWRSENSYGPFSKIGSTTEDEYTDSDVKGGTTYYYKLKGKAKGINSMREYGGVVYQTVKFKAPVIEKSYLAKNQIKLSWNKDENATGYIVYKKLSSTDEFAVAATIESKDITEWTDSSIDGKSEAVYKICAYNMKKDGTKFEGDSTEAEAKIPDAPTLKARNGGAGKVKLSWNSVKHVDGYRIYRYNSDKKEYTLVKTISGETCKEWTNTGLKSGKRKEYKICTYINAENGEKVEGNLSNRAYATPNSMFAPNIENIAYVGKNYIKIDWNTIKNADGYKIYRKKANGSWKRVATVKGKYNSEYKDIGVSGTNYYKVCAYRYKGGKIVDGNKSDEIKFRTLGKPKISISCKNKTNTIKWNKVPYATNYLAYEKIGDNGKWKSRFIRKGELETDYNGGIVLYHMYRVRARHESEDGEISIGEYSDIEKKRWVGTPKGSTYYQTKGYRNSIYFDFTNQASVGTVRFYSNNAKFFDRNADDVTKLKLVSKSGKAINYIDVKPGETKGIHFKAVNSIWDDAQSVIYCEFRYGGKMYKLGVGIDFGAHYGKK